MPRTWLGRGSPSAGARDHRAAEKAHEAPYRSQAVAQRYLVDPRIAVTTADPAEDLFGAHRRVRPCSRIGLGQYPDATALEIAANDTVQEPLAVLGQRKDHVPRPIPRVTGDLYACAFYDQRRHTSAPHTQFQGVFSR